MNPFEKIERAIGKVFHSTPDHRSEPVELRRAVLREIADQVQPAGNGEYLFPFTGAKVELFASDASAQASLEAIFSLPGFAEDAAGAIANRGCRVAKLEIQVEVMLIGDAEAAGGVPYRITYQRLVPGSARSAKPRPPARLVVLEGRANVEELLIDRDLVYIGRLKDVVNSRTGLERQNQLAFDASESTVSRKHARLEYEPDTGRFRLFNDPEQTSVSRDGRGIPCDATRGVQLRSGDQIVLGRARVRFDVADNLENRPAANERE